LEEARQKEVYRLAEEHFKKDNLVCNVQQYIIFPPKDSNGNPLSIPIEISFIVIIMIQKMSRDLLGLLTLRLLCVWF
jgi:hypothetical protein